jgi:hypothetical protein
MFCKNCGAELADDARFCNSCGAAAGEAAPAPKAAPAKAGDLVASIKKNLHLIVGALGILALVLAIFNIFGLYEVTTSAKIIGHTAKGHADISDVCDASTGIMIANILYGLACLAIAAAGALYFLKVTQNKDLYDKFVAKYTKNMPILSLIGSVGFVFSVLKLLLYVIAKPSEMGISVSVSMHWFGWVMLFVYAGLVCADKFWLNKKQ